MNRGLDNESRQHLVAYKIERANEMIRDVEMLLDYGSAISAMNRLYYACYYAAEAALIDRGVIANTHAGVRTMLNLHFIKSGLLEPAYGKMYGELFLKRQDGDYGDFQYYEVEDVVDYLPQAKEFIHLLSEIISKHN